MLRRGGRLREGRDTCDPVGEARYGSTLCPDVGGGYAYALIEGDGYECGEG